MRLFVGLFHIVQRLHKSRVQSIDQDAIMSVEWHARYMMTAYSFRNVAGKEEETVSSPSDQRLTVVGTLLPARRVGS